MSALTPPPRQTLMRSLSLTVGMSYGGPEDYGFTWDGRKYPGEIGRLQQLARPASLPRRASLYRQIGEFYQAAGEPAQAKKAFEQSVSLYARQWKQEPASDRNGALLAEYALSLLQAGQIQEAEIQVRKAVRLAPESWQVWTVSGQIRTARAVAMTAPERSAGAGKTPSTTTQTAWQEARQDFDTAVKLAPHLPQPYEKRAAFRVTLSFAMHPSLVSSVAGLPDIEKAVALRPQDPYALAALAWLEYTDYGTRYYPGQSYDNFSIFKVLPPANRRRVLTLRRRIEHLANSQDTALHRARAYTALAWLEYEFHDVPPAQPQQHLRQAMQLQSDLIEAEQFLMHTYGIEEQWDSLAQFSAERAQNHPTARYHLIAAFASYKANHPAQAEAQLQAALKLNPTDPTANLFLTFLLLRSNIPEKVEAAGPVLDAADAALSAPTLTAPDREVARGESAVLRGFYFALIGKQEEARQQFTRILAEDKENSAARQGLTLLTPTTSRLPPSRCAGEYIEGELEATERWRTECFR